MKIAVTHSFSAQVSAESYREIHTTRIFDGTVTFNEIEQWVRKWTGGKEGWQSLNFSHVDETEESAATPQENTATKK